MRIPALSQRFLGDLPVFFADAFLAVDFLDVDFLPALAALREFNADFSVELAENFIALEALIATGAPVCGLRPVRAARRDIEKEPKPGHATLSPRFTDVVTVLKNSSSTCSASFLVTPT
jgi:hypothetical protein